MVGGVRIWVTKWDIFSCIEATEQTNCQHWQNWADFTCYINEL